MNGFGLVGCESILQGIRLCEGERQIGADSKLEDVVDRYGGLVGRVGESPRVAIALVVNVEPTFDCHSAQAMSSEYLLALTKS